MATLGMSHLEVTVRDLGRSLGFYRDLLGLRVLFEGTTDQAFPDAANLRIYTRSSCEFRFAVLHPGEEPGPFAPGEMPTIVLLCPIVGTAEGEAIKVDQLGITHFGLWVRDLDTTYADLEARGATCLEAPNTMMTIPTGTVRSAFLQDPDGVIVQLDELVTN